MLGVIVQKGILGGVMIYRFSVVALLLFSIVGQAALEDLPRVKDHQFAKGDTWIWLYSIIKSNGDTEPYYYEKYQVTEVLQRKITVVMSSWPVGEAEPDPHHRFVMDMKRCGKRGSVPAPRNFPISFYRKDPGGSGNWLLVSKKYSNIAFSEKFNCFTRIGAEPLLKATRKVGSLDVPTLKLKNRIHSAGNSEYAQTETSLRGVAVYKLFEPRKVYQFQLIQHP